MQKSIDISDVKIQLSQQGWVLLSNKNEEDVKEIINHLGETTFTTNDLVKEESKELTTTENAIDFHTETHGAKYVAWYCVRQTEKGGETILMDAEKAYHRISVEHRIELENIIILDPNTSNADVVSYPLVNNKGLRRFYYSFNLFNAEQKNNLALLEFQRIIKESEPITILLKPNDVLIIDNHRILNGRTSNIGYSGSLIKQFFISI